MTRVERTIRSTSEAMTIELGRRMGAALQAGDCLALSGELGAGKTRFVQGLAQGLGIDPREVSSPTFVLCHVYQGRATLLHVDAYRLGSAHEFEELGILEQLATGAIVVIEWGERVAAALPPECLHVVLTETTPTEREVEFSVPAERICILNLES